MRVMLLTWEFPPYKVGGIGSHCYDLSQSLAEMGHDVHVITYGDSEKTEQVGKVAVHRVPSANAPDTISWSIYLGQRMEKKAIELQKEGRFDLVHAHDWMTVPAAVGIKKMLGLPFVFTLHSTEHGRSGVHDSYTKMINDLEWYGTYECSELVTVGKDFCSEVRQLFRPPENKLHYIPNGIDIARFDKTTSNLDKKNFSSDWEKMVLFAGRMVNQKGVDHLLHAIPMVLREHPEAKFVLAGGGGLEHYRKTAFSLGIDHKTFFIGHVEEKVVFSLFKIADVSVAPSVYEPFGIVALESFAARTPMVASAVGGLKETIQHEWSGLHTYPASPQSIADQLNRVLWDLNWGRWMGDNGRKSAEKDFGWDKIAACTTGVYGKTLELW